MKRVVLIKQNICSGIIMLGVRSGDDKCEMFERISANTSQIQGKFHLNVGNEWIRDTAFFIANSKIVNSGRFWAKK